MRLDWRYIPLAVDNSRVYDSWTGQDPLIKFKLDCMKFGPIKVFLAALFICQVGGSIREAVDFWSKLIELSDPPRADATIINPNYSRFAQRLSQMLLASLELFQIRLGVAILPAQQSQLVADFRGLFDFDVNLFQNYAEIYDLQLKGNKPFLTQFARFMLEKLANDLPWTWATLKNSESLRGAVSYVSFHQLGEEPSKEQEEWIQAYLAPLMPHTEQIIDALFLFLDKVISPILRAKIQYDLLVSRNKQSPSKKNTFYSYHLPSVAMEQDVILLLKTFQNSLREPLLQWTFRKLRLFLQGFYQ